MMQWGRLLSIVACFVLAAGALTSCVQRPQDEIGTEWQGKEDHVTVNDSDGSAAERYSEYKYNASVAFLRNETADGADFTTEALEGGVRITGYVGKEQVVVIPEQIGGKTVLSLGEGAFADSTVRAVKVPATVTNIGKGAFENCANLTTLALPFVGDGGENTHLGYIFGANSYEQHALKVPATLDMVILSDNVERIAANAFAGCKSLSAVVLPDSVKEIGDFAFYECRDLCYLELGEGLESLGRYALGYCSALYELDLAGVRDIGLGALYECNSLMNLFLPFVGGSETENRFIGYIFGAESADFNGEFVPTSLKNVFLPGCVEIPDRAFADCANIQSVLFDGYATERIGIRAFYGCRSLGEIDIPNSVQTIGDDAFFGCDNLKSVRLADGIESIGMQAFYGCRSLVSVEMPEGLTEIRASTFALCESLTSVALKNVKKIGKDAFWGCFALTSVDCNGIEVDEGNESLTGQVEGE